MKKWIIPMVAGLGFVSIVQATEHAYLYKDLRIMAMGGANVAAGGYSSSLFSNPAGIANMPEHHGMVVELLGLSGTGSSNGKNIINDINDAIDTDTTDAILDVFSKYSGERVHVDVSNYSSLSMNHGDYAWSVGLLSAVDANMTPHASSYDLLEVQSRAYGGITAAYAHTLKDIAAGDLTLGVGAKFIKQKSYEGALTPDDLINYDDIGDELRDKWEKDGTGFGLDLGAIYEFHTDSDLKPALGLSVMNIGNMTFDDSYGGQPTTVNIGASIEPTIPHIVKTRIALDYVDLFNANKTRIYNLDTPDNNISFTDYDDTDFVKRLRFGISAMLYDNSWSSMEVATGVYQGNLTAGIDFTASVFRLGFTTYEEELGPEYGDDSDRRYSVILGIVW